LVGRDDADAGACRWQVGYEITLRPPSVTPVVDRRELIAVFMGRV
jgi:hypothetical protein